MKAALWALLCPAAAAMFCFESKGETREALGVFHGLLPAMETFFVGAKSRVLPVNAVLMKSPMVTDLILISSRCLTDRGDVYFETAEIVPFRLGKGEFPGRIVLIMPSILSAYSLFVKTYPSIFITDWERNTLGFTLKDRRVRFTQANLDFAIPAELCAGLPPRACELWRLMAALSAVSSGFDRERFLSDHRLNVEDVKREPSRVLELLTRAFPYEPSDEISRPRSHAYYNKFNVLGSETRVSFFQSKYFILIKLRDQRVYNIPIRDLSRLSSFFLCDWYSACQKVNTLVPGAEEALGQAGFLAFLGLPKFNQFYDLSFKVETVDLGFEVEHRVFVTVFMRPSSLFGSWRDTEIQVDLSSAPKRVVCVKDGVVRYVLQHSGMLRLLNPMQIDTENTHIPAEEFSISRKEIFSLPVKVIINLQNYTEDECFGRLGDLRVIGPETDNSTLMYLIEGSPSTIGFLELTSQRLISNFFFRGYSVINFPAAILDLTDPSVTTLSLQRPKFDSSLLVFPPQKTIQITRRGEPLKPGIVVPSSTTVVSGLKFVFSIEAQPDERLVPCLIEAQREDLIDLQLNFYPRSHFLVYRQQELEEDSLVIGLDYEGLACWVALLYRDLQGNLKAKHLSDFALRSDKTWFVLELGPWGLSRVFFELVTDFVLWDDSSTARVLSVKKLKNNRENVLNCGVEWEEKDSDAQLIAKLSCKSQLFFKGTKLDYLDDLCGGSRAQNSRGKVCGLIEKRFSQGADI